MNQKPQHTMSIVNPNTVNLSLKQKLGLCVGVVGLFILILAGCNASFPNKTLFLILSLVLITVGSMIFSNAYLKTSKGIKNDGIWFKSLTSRGTLAWLTGILITTFYIVLYFFPEYLGLGTNGNSNSGLIAFFDPLSKLLNGNPASQWFVYGTLYTLVILIFGYKFILKYRHNRYQQLRTISVMFFQLGFAFLIPEFMSRLNASPNYNLPYYDLKSMWPLNYYLFDSWSINGLLSSGNLGLAMLIFGILSIFIISPILTYKYGKRWYCSWVCGCGGLAETAGDPFRHLSSKKLSAWKIERWLIHTVLVFSVIMTIAVIYSYLMKDPDTYWLSKNAFLLGTAILLTIVFTIVMLFKRHEIGKDASYGAIGYFVIITSLITLYVSGASDHIFLIKSSTLRAAYGFYIGSIFSGVIGTGFYPIFGNRVWCRFGCPMAAILGFQQRLFSKFRITTNGGQCISCGNCSTYCEMGIDVRAYAQKGENIVRSSCVGCGICSAVCPRGVLKLENDSMHGRINSNDILLGNNMDLIDLLNNQQNND
ncbi:4Fe-4S binding protein [Aestuariibaculum sediminum]|uniref:4Fe-4S binding protein n=1 Tax=Aestuariibaculum sediminum TaxID=2770637 RepID=A0A8J6QF17_9FLAO|nr:4Fe-4S dicluster domain-containing protein [Aestuariibaculum sediminum]MBD0830784.1 4Fe-4S binding protein [Aestuariibaculum sediminum]